MVPEHCKRCKELIVCFICNKQLCSPKNCPCPEEERNCEDCTDKTYIRKIEGHYKLSNGAYCCDCYDVYKGK